MFTTSNNLCTFFNQLQKQLGGKLIVKSKEYRLEIKNNIANGFISALCVQDGINYFEYNIVFKDDTSLLQRPDISSSIYLGYCSKGEIIKTFGVRGKENKLTHFQTGIFSNSGKESVSLNFKKDNKVQFSLIVVDFHSVTNDELRKQLQDTFIIDQENVEFSYIGSYSINILEKINYLHTISEKGLVRSLLINNMVNLILTMEIEKHKDNLSAFKNDVWLRSQANMRIIRNTSQPIKNLHRIQYHSNYPKFITV